MKYKLVVPVMSPKISGCSLNSRISNEIYSSKAYVVSRNYFHSSHINFKIPQFQSYQRIIKTKLMTNLDKDSGE